MLSTRIMIDTVTSAITGQHFTLAGKRDAEGALSLLRCAERKPSALPLAHLTYLCNLNING